MSNMIATKATEHRVVVLLKLGRFGWPLGSLTGSRGSLGLLWSNKNGSAILTGGKQEEVATPLLGRKIKLIH